MKNEKQQVPSRMRIMGVQNLPRVLYYTRDTNEMFFNTRNYTAINNRFYSLLCAFRTVVTNVMHSVCLDMR
jgi:hypothetical protein